MEEQNLKATTNTVIDFIRAYKNRPAGESEENFLIRQFKKYPELWKNEEECRRDAAEIVQSIQAAEAARQEYEVHRNAGKSQESYMASKIETGAKVSGAVAVGNYARGIDRALETANEAMRQRVTTAMGEINQNPQLKGIIMETDHVNTFNIDAAAKESTAQAQALDSHGLNSVDVTVKNPDGTTQNYQAKCGMDADHTNQAFENGDYTGQEKLVPKGQTQDVPNSTDHLESKDGVKSTARTNEEYEQKQEEFQKQEKPEDIDPGYEWKGVNKVAIAKSIGRKAMWAGLLAVGFQGARILGRRIWNYFTGKENPTIEEDLREFVISAITSGAGAGLTVAVTGGITVAVKSGWLGTALKATPVGWIANSVCIGIENVKIFWKLGRGEISVVEAMDMAARTSISMAGGLIVGSQGAAIGAAIGTIFGPVGTAIGGLAGGIVGGIAGSTFGEAVYDGAKKAVSAVWKAGKAVAETGLAVLDGIGSGIASVGRGIASIFSW